MTDNRERFVEKLVNLFRIAGLGELEAKECADSAMRDLIEPEMARMVAAAERRGAEAQRAFDKSVAEAKA